jgi:hypothetical protein
MDNEPKSAIAKLVAHHGGPTEVSRLMGGTPAYQEVQRWVKRGWASSKHIFRLEPLLLDGMTVRDLNADRERSPEPVAEATTHA